MSEQSNEASNGSSENLPQPLYVTLILDETGSMQDCKGAAIAGFNHYVANLRNEPADTRVTLTLFNSKKTEVRYQAIPVTRVHDLDVERIDLKIRLHSMMRSVARSPRPGRKCRPGPEGCVSF